MTALIIIITLLLAAMAVVGTIMYLHSRRTLREQKNFERALKMVPLIIHLPPLSDDTDGANRDVRDVTDENISKAQILYNIIASTVQKGFKTKLYGQRHVGFEIIGVKGFVYFYAAVPVALVDVVKQAVVSAYPTARLEEVAEHNIFSPVGRISGTIGGELVLKENFAYPIATYQDLKRDALQSLLNALSTLDREDGAGIQILLRPADKGWTKKATALSGKKRKGKDKKKKGAAMLAIAKQVAVAPVKAPDDKGGKPEEKHELSSLEQSVVDAIDEKTRYPGFEVMIRVVASSNISSRAQTILNNVVASFALFDSPGKNGFKYTAAKDIESFVTAYIMRFFPPENNQNILNSVELSTLFHFPDQNNIPTTQLERQASKQVDGPRNVSESGLAMGYNIFRGAKKRINLAPDDRARHVYIVGQTGTGKSTHLENMALQDMLNGGGFAFIDPHGDTAERLLGMVPKERTEDVIYFSPADMEYPLGLNLFEYDDPDQKDFLIQETINMLYKLYDPQHQGIIGPRYEHLFRNAALTVMADPAGGTFVDIPKLFNDDAFMKQKLQYVEDQLVRDFWLKEMPASQRSSEFGEVKSWFVSKFGAFLSNQMMRNIIGQPKSAFNLRDIMDNKKILLVNLSKGRTGELNSKLLGMIFVMKFQAAAMSRAQIDEKDRVDFSLYVDEFQNFSTDSFATILSEARKYHLNLIVANQFTTQLSDEIRDAVFGNVGTIVSYRVGTNDAEFLAKYFAPVFDISDLQRVPNHNAIIRMMIGGVPSQPFSMVGLPPLGNPSKQLCDALKQLSAAKYGKPKAQVEAAIFSRLKTDEPAGRPGAAPAAGGFGQPAAAGQPPAAPARPANFVDEWMNKRAKPMQARPNPWNKQAAAQPAPASAGQPASPTVHAQPPIGYQSGTPMPQHQQPQQQVQQQLAQPAPSSAAPQYQQAHAAQPYHQAVPPAQNPAAFAPVGQPAQFGQQVQPLASAPAAQAAPYVPPQQIQTLPPQSQQQHQQTPQLQQTPQQQAPQQQPVQMQPMPGYAPPATSTLRTQPTYQYGGSTQPMPTAAGAMNISSNEVDKQEVSNIAQELKHDLRSGTKSEQPAQKLAVQPAPASAPLGMRRSDQILAENDTIIIDSEGNFQQRASAEV